MAGSAAAASVGAANGAIQGKIQAQVQAARNAARARAESAEIQKQETALVKKLIQQYDTDGSGSFDDQELASVLSSFSFECFGLELTPSQQDLSFLHFLVDQQGGKKQGDGVFSGREITAVLDIWCAYLERYELAQCLLRDFDLNQNGGIEESELPALLQALERRLVPDEVCKWIFEQSNTTGCGSLSGIEVARAIVCYYKWRGKNDPIGDPRRLKGYITSTEGLPPPKEESCCTLS